MRVLAKVISLLICAALSPGCGGGGPVSLTGSTTPANSGTWTATGSLVTPR